MDENTQPKGPYKLVTVNTAPDRARLLVGRVAEQLKDTYTINHVGNVEAIEEVEPAVTQYQPDVLFCASMWTKEQSAEIQNTARRIKPDIITHAIPYGLHIERGSDAIVEHLVSVVPKLLQSHDTTKHS